jgi:hypothetical protein
MEFLLAFLTLLGGVGALLVKHCHDPVEHLAHLFKRLGSFEAQTMASE